MSPAVSPGDADRCRASGRHATTLALCAEDARCQALLTHRRAPPRLPRMIPRGPSSPARLLPEQPPALTCSASSQQQPSWHERRLRVNGSATPATSEHLVPSVPGMGSRSLVPLSERRTCAVRAPTACALAAVCVARNHWRSPRLTRRRALPVSRLLCIRTLSSATPCRRARVRCGSWRPPRRTVRCCALWVSPSAGLAPSSPIPASATTRRRSFPSDILRPRSLAQPGVKRPTLKSRFRVRAPDGPSDRPS
jgi:hypothetical protein